MNQDPDVRGRAAEDLLRNELLAEIFDALDEQYVQAWRGAKTVEVREDAHRYVTIIDKVISDLQSVALTGDLDRKRKAELETGKRPLF